jgi:hypothetical protein
MGLMIEINNVFPQASGKNINVQAPDGKEYSLGPGDLTPRIPVEQDQNLTICAAENKGCAVQFKKTCGSFSGLTLEYKADPDYEWIIMNTGGLSRNGDQNVNVSAGEDDQ